MNKKPNQSNNELNNEEAKVLSDEELDGIVGGGGGGGVFVEDELKVNVAVDGLVHVVEIACG